MLCGDQPWGNARQRDGFEIVDQVIWERVNGAIASQVLSIMNEHQSTTEENARGTQQQGLLAAALAVREGRDIKAVLTANTFKNRTTWKDAGFRLLEATATNANHALLSWSIPIPNKEA